MQPKIFRYYFFIKQKKTEARGGTNMEAQFKSNQNVTRDASKSKKKGFFEKAKEHKKEIVIGAAIVISAGVAVLVVKNKAAFKSVMKSSGIERVLTNSIETRNHPCPLILEADESIVTSNMPDSDIINVSGHIRNLPDGWNPSIKKVELASKHGYSLEGHQTWVDAYTKASA